MHTIGKFLIFIGLFIVFIGVIILVGQKVGLGKIPGDIFIKKGNFTFFFPLMSCIILSIVLSIILNIFNKLK
ncbi:MAG: DUF2905 domain-containing protein [Firmicutes bacterium]|nr:DUF2905 domain-containing protein [Bacillota bacterium]